MAPLAAETPARLWLRVTTDIFPEPFPAYDFITIWLFRESVVG